MEPMARQLSAGVCFVVHFLYGYGSTFSCHIILKARMAMITMW
jgi:hypothetical protein